MSILKADKIKEIAKKYPDPKLIERAYRFTELFFIDQKEIPAADYISHALKVAAILNELGLDSKTIAAGLLHDILDVIQLPEQKTKLNEIKKEFGEEIAFLVEKSSELSKIRYSLSAGVKENSEFSKDKFENLQKMFFALSGDLRVILIILASRLDNLEHLQNQQPEQQKIYALETLKIFSPIADKLGIWEIKYKLEDLAFFYLLPEKMKWLHTLIKEKYRERKNYLKHFTKHLKKLLKKNEVNVINIDFRPKSYWSTYKKLLKYNNDIEKIHDLLALRVIVSTIENCYKTLGIIQKRWKPLYQDFDDYITKPKLNGYRSLHTTVFSEDGHITEIQIRTPEMQKEAEYGICAHWAYKEKIDLLKNKEELQFAKEIPELWKKLKIDFYENKVFVFTPKGDVISLAKEATPIDFAYAVHSEIGNHCEGAKINGKISTLHQLLENGDVVEIITNKNRKPSLDWLKFAKTNLAVSQIKKELAKGGLSAKIAALSKIPSLLKKRVFEISKKIARKKPLEKKKEQRIYLAGQKGIMVTKAKCCSPKPGNEVQAYISKYRAAVLHKTSCKNFQKLAKKFPEKIIDASWGE